MEAAALNENRRGPGWTAEEGILLFEEASKISGLNESTAENDNRWQYLANYLSFRWQIESLIILFCDRNLLFETISKIWLNF